MLKAEVYASLEMIKSFDVELVLSHTTKSVTVHHLRKKTFLSHHDSTMFITFITNSLTAVRLPKAQLLANNKQAVLLLYETTPPSSGGLLHLSRRLPLSQKPFLENDWTMIYEIRNGANSSRFPLHFYSGEDIYSIVQVSEWVCSSLSSGAQSSEHALLLR